MYYIQVKSPARRDKKFKRLSVSSKVSFSRLELIAYAGQYAQDNQLGINQIIVQCVDSAGNLQTEYNPYSGV